MICGGYTIRFERNERAAVHAKYLEIQFHPGYYPKIGDNRNLLPVWNGR